MPYFYPFSLLLPLTGPGLVVTELTVLYRILTYDIFISESSLVGLISDPLSDLSLVYSLTVRRYYERVN